jgi:CheY-like chemotaxis protein/HPt (histidine-containing phosphotransfer) domain-containing protein
MGGKIWVESEIGKGSIFHFTIVAGRAQMSDDSQVVARAAVLRDKRLLVVDDNATNRRIVELQTEPWGMQLSMRASGAEALAALNGGAEFDAVLLDAQMPEMDGLAVAGTIRKKYSPQNLPIILYSSSVMYDDAMVCAHLGIVAILMKPVRQSRLIDTLVSVLGPQDDQSVGRKQKHTAARLLAEEVPLRILLAEDNVINQRVALAMLSRFGYRADVAGNGIEVLAALERSVYDVVLMDVQMPEMDGISATRKIRTTIATDKQPRIIAMTANVSTDDRTECMAAGMDDFLGKPIRVEDLASALSRVRAESRPVIVDADPSADQVLDIHIVDLLRELGGLEEIIGEFMGEVPARIEAMRRATESSEFDALKLEAHTLKGASSVVGAALLAKTAAKLEQLARIKSTNDAASLLEQLDRDFVKTRTALNAELAKPNAELK